MDRVRALDPVAVAGTVGGVAAVAALIAVAEAFGPVPNLSSLFLLPVMLSAVTWGWWYALGTAILSFLVYNFLFVEPRYTLTIYEPQEWVSLAVFSIVAAVTSNLAARERARRQEAIRQAGTASLLYELSRALDDSDLESGLRAVAERLRQELGLDGVVVARSDPDGYLTPLMAVGTTAGALGSEPVGRVFVPSLDASRAGRWVVVRARGGAGRRAEPAGPPGVPGPRRRAPIANFPLRQEGRQIGMLRLVGRPGGLADDETRFLTAVADRLAVALASADLREEANRAEVLRRADDLRTALLSSVSHDLRTPLAAIKASAESLLQKDVPWSEEDRDAFAAAIDREADRLTRLVANLLDMSRIEGGALRPRRGWYDLGELAREVLARLSPILADRPVELRVEPDLPPVALDYLMIGQVVTNLVENAVKYTPPGSPLHVAVRRDDGAVRLEVEDRGPGVPADRRARVFDKFSRLEPAGRASGSGLGLAISRGFVEAHDGRIWVEAGNGPPDSPGARFVIALPVSEPGTAEALPAGAADVASGRPDEHRKAAVVPREPPAVPAPRAADGPAPADATRLTPGTA